MIQHKRLAVILVVFTFIMTSMPQVFFADEAQSMRRVYLHAQENPTGEASMVSEAYVGNTMNLYFAVDDPNKGAYDANTGIHSQPQYDMNGYTVKFYYDPAYFAFAGTDPNKPIDYQVPGNASSSENPGEIDDGNLGDVDVEIGYYVHAHGAGTETIDNITYNTAYITVLFSGSWLPERNTAWYDLCALPLRPLKAGISEVFVSLYDSDDPYTLELLAKDAGPDYPPIFDFEPVNNGRHQIQIKNQQRPAAPVANPPSGSYTQPQNITLTAEPGCAIYYTTAENPQAEDYRLYEEPILITSSTTLRCYSQRLSDAEKSLTAAYTYQFIPTPPVLYFDEAGSRRIPNAYDAKTAFSAYVDDGVLSFGIADDSEVFYTFSMTASENDMEESNDPNTGWCKVSKQLGYIEIDSTQTVRLVTNKGGEYSPCSVYYLGIAPAPALADKEPSLPQEPVKVSLSTETEGAEIYYTLDGSDPRINGIFYTGPILIDKTCTLRTVAKYNGVYSDVTSYHYLFAVTDSYGVDAFQPAGVYEETVNVSLTARDDSKKIYYTTDGSLPSAENGILFERGSILTITEDTQIQAVCVDDAGISGQIYTFHYQIKPAAPVFAPETTQFTNIGEVTVYMPVSRDDYALYYTTDGSVPDTGSFKAEGDSVILTIDRYTKVSAVVVKNGTVYSDIVTHSYDVVKSRPSIPMMTRTPSVYSVSDNNALTTQFLPVTHATEIYYTIAYQSDGGYPPEDPTPGAEGTLLYTPGTEIELKGETMIKAVAQNAFGIRSELGVFHYTVTPEAPTAPPSAFVAGSFDTIPVRSIDGASVTYNIGGEENTVTLSGISTFYIDTATGNAYADAAKTDLLCENDQPVHNDRVELSLFCELNGVKSLTNRYTYQVDEGIVAAPFADKASGTYEQIAIDGENHLLRVMAACLDSEAEIYYSTGSEWLPYQDEILLKDDAVLQLRAQKDGSVSEIVSYVYTFQPPAPVITAGSGTYTAVQTRLELPAGVPTDRSYEIYYRRNGDGQDVRYTGGDIEIDRTMSLKAYIVESNSGKRSKNTIATYIIDQNSSENGTVYVAAPFDLTTRFDVSRLEEEAFAGGIKLLTDNGAASICYTYTYVTADGNSYTTDVLTYQNVPILFSPFMRELVLTAWLVDSTGTEIDQSLRTFSYELVNLGVPKTTLELEGANYFTRITSYTIQNDWEEDPYTSIYYTLDGSDPSDPENENRIRYNGETLRLSSTTEINTVYCNVCGICDMCQAEDYGQCRSVIYGPVNEKTFSVRLSGGSSGGGGGRGSGTVTVTEDREYTKDVFGIEHPTHMGYISGYPDGTVRADSSITREEIAAILYRIINKTYEEPFESTGTVFKDVSNERWSVLSIEYLAKKGVIEGYPDGAFRPEENLTRAEFAALIRRLVGIKATDEENPFPDVAPDFWAYEDIVSLCQAGYVEGYEDGTFRPERPVTRAEVMEVVNVVLGRKPSEAYIKTLHFNPFSDLDENAWYYATVLEATVTHDYFLDDNKMEYKWENWR